MNSIVFVALTFIGLSSYMFSNLHCYSILDYEMSIITTTKRSNLSTRSSVGKSRRSVRFQLNYNLKSVLTDFENEKEQQNYKELVCTIRDAGLAIRVSTVIN